MTTRKTHYVGQIHRPGERPQNLDMAVNRRPDRTEPEKTAGIEWVDPNFDPGYIERYGGKADGATDSTAALELAVSAGRQAVKFWDVGRPDVLNDYDSPYHFYIVRDAYIQGSSLFGPANLTSDGTQSESILRLGRDALNGAQWGYKVIQDIVFSGKQRADNCITFGSDNLEPNNLTSGWSFVRCRFERPNIGIWKQYGNLGNSFYDCSAASGNFGYHATGYPVHTTLSANEASGQTVLSVVSSQDMNALDVVRILMDDATIHQSTIASVDSATQITIDDATDDTAAAGNYVKAYHPDDAIPVTLQHTGADRFYGGEWAGFRKAAFYIDGQQTPGNGGHIFDGVIIESNLGFGIFVKDYNNAFNPMILRNVWFESNATESLVDLDDGVGDRAPRDLYLEKVDHCIVDGSQLRDIEIIDSYVEFNRCKVDSTSTEFHISGESHVVLTNIQIVQWGDDDVGANDVVIESITGPLRLVGSTMRQWIAPARETFLREPPKSGVYVGGDTFENGEDLIGIDSAADKAATIVDGHTFPTASRYALNEANAQWQTGATASAASVTADKFIVATHEMRLVSGELSNVAYIGGAAWTRGDADALLNNNLGEWRTLAWVGSSGDDSGVCRLRFSTPVGETGTVIDLGPNQVAEFDTEGEAIDYYNQRYLCVDLNKKLPQFPTSKLPSSNSLQPGLVVFDTTTATLKYDNGSNWQTITGANSGASEVVPVGVEQSNIAEYTLTATGTADATYSSNEQTMLNNIKADLIALKANQDAIIVTLEEFDMASDT